MTLIMTKKNFITDKMHTRINTHPFDNNISVSDVLFRISDGLCPEFNYSGTMLGYLIISVAGEH